MEPEQIYTPPTAELATPSEERPLASRWLRLWGALIDTVLGTVAMLPVILLVLFQLDFERALESQDFVDELIVNLIGWLIFLVLHGYFLAKRGQTIGKMIVKTRIVDVRHNTILPLWKVISLRYLPLGLFTSLPIFGALFGIVNCLFIFRADKRCVHDLIAGTKVISLKDR